MKLIMCVWVLTIFCISGQGQIGLTGLLTYGQAFAADPGPWGGSAYTASLSSGKEFSIGMQGERLFGTDLSYYEISLISKLKSNGGIGLVLTRKGTEFLSESAGSLSWGKQLGASLHIGVRLGYKLQSAVSYGAESSPVAGLGLGFKINEHCQWMFQADHLNGFFSKETNMGYRIRTGLGYNFSSVCFGTIEFLAEQNSSTRFIAGLHYKPIDEVSLRFGFASDMFLVSGSFHYQNFYVGVNASWHMVMGMSSGLCVSYTFKKG